MTGFSLSPGSRACGCQNGQTARFCRGSEAHVVTDESVDRVSPHECGCEVDGVQALGRDDLSREGMVRVLGDAGVEVVGETGDVDGLMRAVATANPDCALVDIRMPATHTDEGIVAAQRIRELHQMLPCS